MALIKCSECGKEISDKATSCPNCGHPLIETTTTPAPAPKKKGGCLKGCLTVVVVLFAFSVISSIFINTNNKQQTINNEQPTEQTAKAIDNIVQFGELGDIDKDITLVVNGVSETKNISAANGYMKYTAESGKYAIINVTIKNNSKSSQRLQLNYFKLIDSTDAEYVSTLIPAADDKFITIDTINPNLDITGNLVFEIPNDLSASECLLKYRDYDLSNGISKFALK